MATSRASEAGTDLITERDPKGQKGPFVLHHRRFKLGTTKAKFILKVPEELKPVSKSMPVPSDCPLTVNGSIPAGTILFRVCICRDSGLI
jgi:hypothetical protein